MSISALTAGKFWECPTGKDSGWGNTVKVVIRRDHEEFRLAFFVFFDFS